MASGGDEPVADGGPDRHSVFAYAFLSALKDERDEEFTATDLFYGPVQQEVAGSSRQTPRYSILRNSNHESGDFVFIQRLPAAVRTGAPAGGSPDSHAGQQVAAGFTRPSSALPAGTHADAPVATPTMPAPHPASNTDGIQAGAGLEALSAANRKSTSMPVNAAASALILNHGFDPFFGSPHGLSGKITMQWGHANGEARVEGGMLYFFDNGPAVDAKGQPVGPVSCDKLRFQNSHISARDAPGAIIPDAISLKVSGRSGEAILYLLSEVAQQVQSDLQRICASRPE